MPKGAASPGTVRAAAVLVEGRRGPLSEQAWHVRKEGDTIPRAHTDEPGVLRPSRRLVRPRRTAHAPSESGRLRRNCDCLILG